MFVVVAVVVVAEEIPTYLDNHLLDLQAKPRILITNSPRKCTKHNSLHSALFDYQVLLSTQA